MIATVCYGIVLLILAIKIILLEKNYGELKRRQDNDEARWIRFFKKGGK